MLKAICASVLSLPTPLATGPPGSLHTKPKLTCMRPMVVHAGAHIISLRFYISISTGRSLTTPSATTTTSPTSTLPALIRRSSMKRLGRMALFPLRPYRYLLPSKSSRRRARSHRDSRTLVLSSPLSTPTATTG